MSCRINCLTRNGYCSKNITKELENLMDAYNLGRSRDPDKIFLLFSSSPDIEECLEKCKGPTCKNYIDVRG